MAAFVSVAESRASSGVPSAPFGSLRAASSWYKHVMERIAREASESHALDGMQWSQRTERKAPPPPPQQLRQIPTRKGSMLLDALAEDQNARLRSELNEWHAHVASRPSLRHERIAAQRQVDEVDMSLFLPPGTHYDIIVGRAPPFVFIDPDTSLGIERYSGYSVDLIEILSVMLNFTYTIQGEAGVGSTAVISQVVDENNTINMAISAFTITSARLAIVDFTQPFFLLGLRIVHNPRPDSQDLWRIFVPFEPLVWGLIVVAFVVILLSYALFEHGLNDAEFRGRPIKDVFLSLYYVFQTAVQQSTPLPETTEGRLLMIGSTAFFFILAATYTAELASFLTANKVFELISDVDQNGEINEIDVASVSEILTLLADSSIESWFVQNALQNAPRNYQYCYRSFECLEMVANGTAGATILDAPAAEYLLGTEASFSSLELLGAVMNPQGYGIVLRQDDPNTPFFNRAILLLRETSMLAQLRALWFPALRVGDSDDALDPVTIQEVGGIFIILAIILGIAWLFYIVRWILYRTKAVEDHRHEPNLTKPPDQRVREQNAMLMKLLTHGRLPERSVRTRLLMKSALETSIDADRRRVDMPDAYGSGRGSKSGVLHGFEDAHSDHGELESSVHSGELMPGVTRRLKGAADKLLGREQR
ncbi:Glutamate receptor ionotropic, kainate 2 [Porphyridium purpureum]|uniref:Glutamate receptor ionotropic, kainate 2 n=1 Tax=Porphyridium purpureum TaxID=35688 RepID=A0A5J4YHV8_PORPP|nr:Glutamate receptor ionotropic, kainate 2 [Porphyridium purpureum]|eukprot:POR2619..scf270_19